MYTDQDISNLVARVQQLEQQIAIQPAPVLPKIGLLSPNFLTRAFAVWGHFFVSNLLISIGLSCIFVIIGLILGKGALDIFQQILGSVR